MANLIIDIGNTSLKAAWAEESTIGKIFRYQGERIINFILSLTSKVKPEVLIISSKKELSNSNIEKLKKNCKYFILLDNNTDLYKKYEVPSYINSDRLATIIAAKKIFNNKDSIIFDFGTTLTIDIISKNGEYLGGNISLGCRTRFLAINRYSNNLPLLNTPDEILNKGNSINSSIESGVISGIIFEIEGYLRGNSQKLVIFTGGDAIYFAKRMKNSIFVVCNLVLIGLAIIADNYEKSNK